MEKPINEQESWVLINQIIQTAKNQLEKYFGIYLLLWGYIVFGAAMLHFILHKIVGFQYADFSYLIIPLGFLGMLPISSKQAKDEKIKTYIGEVVGYLWIAFAITSVLLGLFVFLNQTLGIFIFPLMLLLIGLVLFVTGVAYRFTPLKVGSMICWAAALAAFLVPFEYQILIYALSILAGYIIPGHIIIKKADV